MPVAYTVAIRVVMYIVKDFSAVRITSKSGGVIAIAFDNGSVQSVEQAGYTIRFGSWHRFSHECT